MTKREEFNDALKNAARNKDKVALSTVRLILAALKDRDIVARGQGKAEGIDEAEILSMLQSMIKQRKESATTYRDAGRAELAEREEEEIEIIKGFMPAQLSDADLGNIVNQLISGLESKDIKNMGKVMGVLKEKYAGQIDMGRAGALVKEKLS